MKETERLIDILKALADETRLRIVFLVWEGEDLCSCEIERILGLKQSNTSRHLHRLREAKILESYKRAQWAHYRIAEEFKHEDSLLPLLLRKVRKTGGPFAEDAARLGDYRSRGFSCATIDRWIPFEVPKGTERK